MIALDSANDVFSALCDGWKRDFYFIPFHLLDFYKISFDFHNIDNTSFSQILIAAHWYAALLIHFSMLGLKLESLYINIKMQKNNYHKYGIAYKIVKSASTMI